MHNPKINKIKVAKINLEKIQTFIEQKTISSSETIDIKLLRKLKIIIVVD